MKLIEDSAEMDCEVIGNPIPEVQWCFIEARSQMKLSLSCLTVQERIVYASTPPIFTMPPARSSLHTNAQRHGHLRVPRLKRP
ncbi:basigin [Pimephales promelas]|nr:basigin [Pimephales promelas]